jgi:hypothetical protein
MPFYFRTRKLDGDRRMNSRVLTDVLAPLIGLAIIAGCSADKPVSTVSGDAGAAESRTTVPSSPRPNYAPANPYLANSVLPIGHINSSQTTGVDHAGPAGPTEELSEENGGLTYTHLGPGHFGAAISPPYPNGKRVIWSNGAERISKLDYDTLEVLSEFHLENSPIYLSNGGPISPEQADKVFARLDWLPKFSYSGLATVFTTIPLAKKYYGGGLAGVYYLLSSDNVLFVGGKESILAYADADPSDPNSDIVLDRGDQTRLLRISHAAVDRCRGGTGLEPVHA